jgi:hypothetical protein
MTGLSWQGFHERPLMTDLSWETFYGRPFMTELSWQNFYDRPFMTDLSWQTSHDRPFITFLRSRKYFQILNGIAYFNYGHASSYLACTTKLRLVTCPPSPLVCDCWPTSFYSAFCGSIRTLVPFSESLMAFSINSRPNCRNSAQNCERTKPKDQTKQKIRPLWGDLDPSFLYGKKVLVIKITCKLQGLNKGFLKKYIKRRDSFLYYL